MKNLGRIMAEKGFSQTELHRRSGVSQSHISDIIRNKKKPTIVVLEKIAMGLDISVSELLTGVNTSRKEQ